MENIIIVLIASGQLDDFLSNLHWLLKDEHNFDVAARLRDANAILGLLLEFDDPWLEGRIRSLYKAHVTNQATGAFLTADLHAKTLFQAYIEDRQKFKTLFKSDDVFWEACRDPNIHTLKSLFGPTGELDLSDRNEELKARRAVIQETLEGTKLRLQKKLSEELKCVVIIGSTRKKIRYGIASAAEAIDLRVRSLREFLRTKKYETAPFNCWYTVRPNVQEKELRGRLLAEIDALLGTELGQLQEMVGSDRREPQVRRTPKIKTQQQELAG